jgi:hypothetical protein
MVNFSLFPSRLWTNGTRRYVTLQRGILARSRKRVERRESGGSRTDCWILLIDSVLQLSGGVEWRQKLDTQRGAVLANELRNNACKLAKWTVQALLAGSDQIKFGYVHLLITGPLGFDSWQVQSMSRSALVPVSDQYWLFLQRWSDWGLKLPASPRSAEDETCQGSTSVSVDFLYEIRYRISVLPRHMESARFHPHALHYIDVC